MRMVNSDMTIYSNVLGQSVEQLINGPRIMTKKNTGFCAAGGERVNSAVTEGAMLTCSRTEQRVLRPSMARERKRPGQACGQQVVDLGVCLRTMLTVLLLVVEVRGQFRLILETNCSDGMLVGDKFRLEAALSVPMADRRASRRAFFYSSSYNRPPKQTECSLDLLVGCYSTAPDHRYGCYCITQGKDNITLTFRQTVTTIYSFSHLKVIWRKSELFRLPGVYDPRSSESGFLQDIEASRYTQSCCLDLSPGETVIYCCKNTAQPCLTHIDHQGQRLATDPICSSRTVTPDSHDPEILTFSHEVCGQSGIHFTCNLSLEASRSGRQSKGSGGKAGYWGVVLVFLCVAGIIGVLSPVLIYDIGGTRRQRARRQSSV